MKNLVALLGFFIFAASVIHAQGHVYIDTKLGIGQSNPFWPLDILSNQAVARLETNGSVNGSVIDLKNTASGSTYLGAVNFSTASGTAGQIAYLTDNNLSFRVGNIERAKMNSSGLIVNEKIGIGQPNPVYPLDILSSQAVGRLETTVSTNGSVIDLKNTAAGSTLLGSLNFSNTGSTPGQIGYLTNNSLYIKVNSSERMRFTPEGKLGIGLSNPQHPVHINQQAGITLTDQQPVLNVEYTGANSNDAVAIRGFSVPAPGKGIGCLFAGGNTAGGFYGGHTGVYSLGYSQNNGYSYGVNAGAYQNNSQNSTQVGTRGYADGHNSTNFGHKGEAYGNNSSNYGVHGHANGTGSTNYGVFGTATNGSTNWAGYFDQGNVYINNKLSIGNSAPIWTLEVSANQSVANLVSTTSIDGTYLVLRTDASSPTTLGTINFSANTNAKGQIAYSANDDFIFRTNGSEKVRISESGRVGIGRVPTLFKLEVEGAASKASAGDWLANSDERLKKNIQPLDAEEMIEKLLALQGVTYEWNDDKTGTTRPEGIQYGFIAQDIQEEFPELVQEDTNGYLVTAYGTYDAMMVEALRYLYLENQSLKNDLVHQSLKNDQEIQSLKSELEEIRNLIRETAGK